MEKTGVRYEALDEVHGLSATDQLVKLLSKISGHPVPESLERERASLIDAMRDLHSIITGKRVVLGLEKDHALSLSPWLTEAGFIVDLVIVPESSPDLHKISSQRVLVGDLSDLPSETDLIITNSHGAERAKGYGVLLYEMGFPVYRPLGYTHNVIIGYRGALNFLNDVANLLSLEVEP